MAASVSDSRKSSGKKRVWRAAAVLVAAPLLYLLILAAPYFNRALFEHNFYEVVPERLYRSARMPGDALGRVIDEHGIKSVIDMRLSGGEHDASGAGEEQIAAAHGAAYRHVPLTSSRTSQRERILRLLDAFDELTPPILVHCTSGSERSGVASAIWLIEKEHRSVAEASEQLGLRFGFNQFERDLRTFFQGEPTLDRVITEYAKARAQHEISFREWARESHLLDSPEQK